jgi:hypothetical protein
MKMFSISLVFLGYFGLIGFAVYLTNSAWPLLALLLSPSFRTEKA